MAAKGGSCRVSQSGGNDLKLIFVRHAEPDYTIDSLTEKGWREAELLAPRIQNLENVKYWYVSPLGRAKDTAKTALKGTGITPVTLDWLREFEGRIADPETGARRLAWDLYPKDWTKMPEMYDKDNWMYAKLYEGSNVADEANRTIASLDALLAEHGYVREGNCYRIEKHNDYTIVFFCHMAISLLMMGHLIGASAPVMWHGGFCAPSGLNILQTEERRDRLAYFRIRALGDVSHLYAAGEPASDSGFKLEREWL